MIPQYYEVRKAILPVYVSLEAVLFPGETQTLFVRGEEAKRAVTHAYTEKTDLLMITQTMRMDTEDETVDFSGIGTVLTCHQLTNLPNGDLQILVEAKHRGRMIAPDTTKGIAQGVVESYIYLQENVEVSKRLEKLMRLCTNRLSGFVEAKNPFLSGVLAALVDEKDPEYLSNSLAARLDLRHVEALGILGELDVEKRFELLYEAIAFLQGLEHLSNELNEQAMARLNKSQQEIMIREKMNILREKLGEDSGSVSDTHHYVNAIEELGLDDDSTEVLFREVDRLEYVPPMSPEYNVIRTYLDTVLDLPWDVYTKDLEDLEKSRRILDQNHYGLKDIKERILEYIAVRQLRNDSKGSILCLVGPPGVGKTSIARSIAQALGRKFTSMRLGGMSDESEIRGHRKTYVGAMPGRIISAMTAAKSMNPVFLLDEIDKIGSDFRGDPASALLEVLDPEQNSEFRDRYVEIPFDLSQVLFVTTANTTATIPSALLDRMEVIEISSYTEVEKFHIAKRFLIRKEREENGLLVKDIRFSDGAITDMINLYTREAGVRELERTIAKVCRRVAKAVVEGKKTQTITKANLKSYLGEARYAKDAMHASPEVGVVNGLAWAETGGEILHIEANTMHGHGSILMTGSLGNVMKESAHTAMSYIRANSQRLGVEDNFYVRDVHIHMPEGAVPKDGPSAGVSLAVALVSVATSRPCRHDVAMTGELTLTGRVLPVGGIREKVLAAKRYRIFTVLLPKENLRDLKELDENVLKDMTIIGVTNIEEVLRKVLLDVSEKSEKPIFQPRENPSVMGFTRDLG